MKKLILSIIFAILLMASPAAQAQIGPQEDFNKTLSHSTLALYEGGLNCAWHHYESFFGNFDIWQCGFKSAFTCTATVIDKKPAGDTNEYTAFTAGHCFNWNRIDKYFVGETIDEAPVLKHVYVEKFENDKRYDYAIIKFRSTTDYTPIELDKDETYPAVGTEFYNDNFSLGLGKMYVQGQVVSEELVDPDVKRRFLVNIGIGPGASGSALVDKKTHKIIGMVEAIFPSTQMPTLCMPTGKTLQDFIADDSTGIKPLPPSSAPKATDPKDESLLKTVLSVFSKLFIFIGI